MGDVELASKSATQTSSEQLQMLQLQQTPQVTFHSDAAPNTTQTQQLAAQEQEYVIDFNYNPVTDAVPSASSEPILSSLSSSSSPAAAAKALTSTKCCNPTTNPLDIAARAVGHTYNGVHLAPLDAPIPTTLYNGPKDTFSHVVQMGVYKTHFPWWKTCLLGFNAGIYLTFGNMGSLAAAAGMSEVTKTTNADGSVSLVTSRAFEAKILYGLVFPVGLLFIILAGGELFTGNVMYNVAAWWDGKVKKRIVAWNLFLVWMSNFIGAVITCFLICYLTELLHSDLQTSYWHPLAAKKLSYGWGMMVLKGVGCNYLVCLAIWCSVTAEDVVSKIIAFWCPITLFVFIGFEHCIANMFLFTLALMEGGRNGIDGKGLGEVLAWNLIPATIGNIMGGILFVSGQYFAYKYVKKDPKQGGGELLKVL